MRNRVGEKLQPVERWRGQGGHAGCVTALPCMRGASSLAQVCVCCVCGVCVFVCVSVCECGVCGVCVHVCVCMVCVSVCLCV